MKKALHKDFWTEIRKTRARFISIFCIVALGVAFFSGIQASSPDMRLSGDAYYTKSALMDLKVVGTLGLTDSDVKALEDVGGVELAEGAWSTDVLCGEAEAQKVLHVESVNQDMNRLTVTDGRLPEKSGECFLDTAFAQSQGYQVGDEITFREDSDEPLLKKETYTVAGLGRSPLYISFNRGNTTLGSGEVNGFAYVLPEDFDSEVFTQIYVRAHGSDEVTSYTDAYDHLIEKVQARVEGIEKERCQLRYDEVTDEAETQLADAEQELADGKKEAEEELADARKKLTDGEKEYEDGKKEYEDGKQQLADARQELEDGRQQLADAKTQLTDGRQQLADAETQLADGRSQLSAGQEKLASGWNEYNNGKKQFDEGKAQLESAKKQLNAGKAEIEKNRTALEEKQKELDDGKAQLTAGQQTVDTQLAQLNEQIPQLQAGIQQAEQAEAKRPEAEQGLETAQNAVKQAQAGVTAAQAAAAPAKEAVNAAQAAVTEKQTVLTAAQTAATEKQTVLTAAQTALTEAQQKVEAGELTQDQLAPYQEAVTAAEKELNAANGEASAAQEALNDATQALTQAQAGLETANQAISQAQAGLDAANQAVSQAQAGIDAINQAVAMKPELEKNLTAAQEGAAQLQAKKTELAASLKELEAGQTAIDEGRAALEKEAAKLAPAEKEIQKNEKTLKASEKTLKDSLAQLQSGQAEIDANRQKLTAAQAEIDANRQKLTDGEAEIASNETKLADGEKEIKENEQKLTDAEQELSDAKKELDDGWKEYRDGEKEAQEEIADGEQKIADAKEELADLEQPEWLVTDRNDLPEYSDYGDNADRIKSIGEVFPVIFFLVAALISLTTMTRMVEEQRTQIGTLKALGYGKYAIASKYLNYAFLATIGGSAAGILIGEKVLPYIIIKAYGIMYHNVSGSLQIHYEWKYALTASLAAIVCTVGATVFSCYKALVETPASLMRPPAPKEGKRVLVEKIPFLWKHLNFTWKSSLRNMFRYKKRLFMTIFGIAGSMALMLVGFGVRDSISDIAVLQYTELQNYDGTIISDEDASDAEKQELEKYLAGNKKLSRYTYIQLTKLNTPNGKSNISIYLYVPQNLDNFHQDVTLRNRRTKQRYELTDAGAVISEKTASLLNLKVGDEITLEKDNEQYKVKVAVITENYMGHYIYMTPAVYEQTFGEKPDYQDIVFSIKDEYKDQEEAIGQEIIQQPGALSISYSDSLAAQVDRMLGTLGVVIIVLIVSAGMLAFVVLYNLNNINITERQRELATLKVLGFFDKEVSEYVLRENILLTIAGIIFGSGFGVLLHRYIIVTVEVDAVMFGRNIRPISFLYCAAITCLFSAVVNLFMHRKLKKIDMVESLKSVE